MKKILQCLLCLVIICSLTACKPIILTPVSGDDSPDTGSFVSQNSSVSSEATPKFTDANEIRAVWLSYLELKQMFQGDFAKNVTERFETLKKNKINTVFVQVRPFSDAIYPSEIFPWSHIITGTQGQDPGYDPLAVILTAAKKTGLQIHAWINPYRIRADAGLTLAEKNPAALWMAEKSDCVCESGEGLYYNPGREQVIDLIVRGVDELVSNYDLDGIHFDDYFYPTTSETFDSQVFAEQGGEQTLQAFRTSKVSSLVQKVYQIIKAKKPTVQFGISPAGNISNNMNRLYADIYQWGGTAGYVDYLCPQIYFGFEHETAPFDTLVKQWNDICKDPSVKLYVGLAAYKIGAEESVYAGSGKNEWQQKDDLLMRQVLSARDCQNYGGFALYRYDSLFSSSLSDLASVQKQKLLSVLN